MRNLKIDRIEQTIRHNKFQMVIVSEYGKSLTVPIDQVDARTIIRNFNLMQTKFTDKNIYR